MTTLICDCNRTMPLDGAALALALGPDAGRGVSTVHSTLCRREAGAFQRATREGEPLLVACTQETRLFLELAEATEGARPLTERPIRFVNIRESGGWSSEASRATPKIAALIAAAQLPDPEPVPTVGFSSAGRLLIIGDADRAFAASRMLVDRLDVSVLVARPGGTLPQERSNAVHAGVPTRITGWLGAFEVEWHSANPINLDLCTRCNACIAACPEQAIDFGYQIDLARCTSHRDCVRVCAAAGAIDFERPSEHTTQRFDLVLDLLPVPFLTLHQAPQGYFRPGADERRQLDAVLELRDLVGEFEKPKFVNYRQNICAHSRNEQIGCDACIEVCSARAIRSDASLKGGTGGRGGIVVEPHLCVGCGACTTVCPTGAISYATPTTDHQGRRVRTLLNTYQRAGGPAIAGAPVLLIHSEGAGSRLIDELGRGASLGASLRGVPARVLPLAVRHTASVGLDLWLSALAYGAGQLLMLLTDEEAPEYHDALAAQAAVANALMEGLGYGGDRVRLLRARDARDLADLDDALHATAGAPVRQAATFAVQRDKRATLDLAIDHLLQHAVAITEMISLPATSPFGSVVVDVEACTMCLACVGACPASALADNAERPQLRFIEKNCVQCGLCAVTCPENAITLAPRLWLADDGKARRQTRVLNEVEPFCCVRCGKPFGTLKAVELMASRLAGHAMFQGAAAERLRMCGDCRVIDIHTDPREVRIGDI